MPCYLFLANSFSARIPHELPCGICKILDYAKENNIQINTLRLNQRASEQQLLLFHAAPVPDVFGSVSQNINRGQDQNTNLSGSYILNSSLTLQISV